MRACHQQDLLQRQRGRCHAPQSRAVFTFLPVTQKSKQHSRYLAVVQASSGTATATKDMHMPNPKSASLPFFTNDLDDSPTDSASESELLQPFTDATYRALQVRQGLTKGRVVAPGLLFLHNLHNVDVLPACMHRFSVSKAFLLPNVTIVAATGCRARHALW